MTIRTSAGIRATWRRANRERRRREQNHASAKAVLTAMREQGQALHRGHERSGERWWLSNGRRVLPEVAELVVNHANVVGCGDTLFENLCPQTFRYADSRR